jgi:hypothetical protein
VPYEQARNMRRPFLRMGREATQYACADHTTSPPSEGLRHFNGTLSAESWQPDDTRQLEAALQQQPASIPPARFRKDG